MEAQYKPPCKWQRPDNGYANINCITGSYFDGCSLKARVAAVATDSHGIQVIRRIGRVPIYMNLNNNSL